MQLELSNDKKICFLIGYVAKVTIENNPVFQEVLQNKIKGAAYYDIEMLHKIYVESVKSLSVYDAASDDVNSILEYTSMLMLQADNDASDLNKYDASYYYTLGFTSKKIIVTDGNIECLECDD